MKRLILFVLVLAAVVLGAAGLLTTGSEAATPSPQNVTAPTTPGQSVTVNWSGVIPNVSDGEGTSDCKDRVTGVDPEDIHITVPAGAYANVDIEYKFSITWDPSSSNDEVLTVVNKDVQDQGSGNDQEGSQSSEVGSSDTSATTEQVVGNNLPTATYEAQACPFLATTPQPYTGRLVITAKAKEPDVPAANSNGLNFSASVPADPQRDAGEPLIEIDRAGNSYTCGPSGFSNAAEYAQVSTDGGDQFHLLGEPPRGQIGLGGGGDCSIATAPDENAQHKFNWAYTGLGPLTHFAASSSSDNGRTIMPNPTSNSIPGVDRQWQVFLDADSVLLNYNQQAPRRVVVQRSDDGGFTYGVSVPASAANPSFPGPMRALPATFNPTGQANGRVAYFPWTKGTNVNLSVSFDGGTTWKQCHVATAPGEGTLFPTADSDSAGTIYVAYGENSKFHTYLTSLPQSKLANCADPLTTDPKTDPGFAAPVQVDRGKIRSTVFPWMTAGGAPGRVAVAFYGTETDGDPNLGDFKASWNVYVNESLDANTGKTASFSQVKATTHPIHYDSICLNGLGCDVSGGDRSLADFFAIDYDSVRRVVQVVYDTTYKKPGEAEGHVATPTVVTQTAGPSLGGGTVAQTKPPVLRDHSSDPAHDAISDYSSLGTPPTPAQEPAADFRSVDIGPGPDNGITVTMKLSDLSDAALAQALGDTKSPRLLWIFRFFNGWQASAAVARYSATDGFSFGYNDFQTGSVTCGSSGEKCLQYPGDQAIQGAADQATGTITLRVPGSKLKALSGSQGPGQRPQQVPAKPGDRLYDGTAFSLADVSPTGGADQSFLYPLDNAPSMDFLIPTAAASGAPGGTPASGATPTGSGKPPAHDALAACRSRLTFRGVSAAGRGRRAVLSFNRRGSAPVQVDVFQSAVGRRVIGERLVARFKHRKRSFLWDGRANRPGRHVRDGYLFVRFKTGPGRGEARRVPLRRAGGRFSRRPGFQRRDTCDLLTSYKLERPAFGGVTGRPLGISFRMSRAGTAQLRITHGTRTIKTVNQRVTAGNRTHRLGLSARGLPRGDYQVRLVVRSGRNVTRSTLVARRL